MTDNAPLTWKFVVEMEIPGKGLMPRVALVHASDPAKAHHALMTELPSANVLGNCEMATGDEITASGGAFLHDEKVRIVDVA